MARRVFLHVGCPKTGTSFLQSTLWENRSALRAQGLLLPASLRHHYRASLVIRDAWRDHPAAEAVERDWHHLLDVVRRTDGDVLVSHELLAAATAEQARFAIDAFGGAETHVIVTARDLARQLPAEWQQSVKQGAVHRLEDFVHDVVHHGPRARWFWRVQDLAGVAERWGATLPAGRLHLVTVPPRAAGAAALWTRFAAVLGMRPDAVDLGGARGNESLGQVEVELLRRVNEVPGDRIPARQRPRWFRDLLANDTLARRAGKERFAVDEGVHEWVRAASRSMVRALDGHGYDVVGDLDDLVPGPEPEPGADPSAASETELLRAATETIVDLLDLQRTSTQREEGLRVRVDEQAQTIGRLEHQLAARHRGLRLRAGGRPRHP